MARKRKRPRKRGKRKSRQRKSREGPDAGVLFMARRGVPEAQFRLADMYLTGQGGVAHDDAKAARWLRAAAEQGHTGAQTILAEMYRDGDGVEMDLEEAARWLR